MTPPLLCLCLLASLITGSRSEEDDGGRIPVPYEGEVNRLDGDHFGSGYSGPPDDLDGDHPDGRRATRKPQGEETPTRDRACWDAVGGVETSHCMGQCVAGIKASGMAAAKKTCICSADRFGRQCALMRRLGGSGEAAEAGDWSPAEEGKIMKAGAGASRPRLLRGLYIVGDVGACEEICLGLNQNAGPAREMPCGTITTSETRDGGILCEVHQPRPVGPCQSWLVAGEGSTTKWLLRSPQPPKAALLSCL